MKSKDPPVHPEAAVAPGYLANHAARAFNRLVDGQLRPYGMSLALLGPVLLLSWKGPMFQRDLVEASAVKQPAMVALLIKLEAMGLVSRETSAEDRRASIVALTSAGSRIARVGGQILIDANELGLDGFSQNERKLLVSLFSDWQAHWKEPTEQNIMSDVFCSETRHVQPHLDHWRQHSRKHNSMVA